MVTMRTGFVVIVLTGVIVMGGACSDSSKKASPTTTTTESACDLGNALQQDVQKLKDMNVLQDGTDAMQPIVDDIKKDADELAASGKSTLQPKVDELKSALTGLSDSLKEIGTNGPGPVASAAASVDAAGDALAKEAENLKCD
jgi:hypothetical protein